MTLLTPELMAMVGLEACYTAPEELGRASIRYFAMAVGDHNPLYTDDAFAREHGHPSVIAPPTLICETSQYAGLPRDADGFAGHRWDIDIPGTRQIRGGNSYLFHRPVSPSDVLTVRWRIADMTERVNSAGFRMLIVTSVAEYTNQRDEPLARNTETMIFVAEEPG